MDIILLERVEKLGQMGDEVTVKDGYARNFLLPQKKALRATAANRARFADQRAQLEARNLEQRSEAEAAGNKLAGASCILVRQAGETGHLYGSASSRDIAEALTAEGFSVNRSQVVLDRPIKMLGVHEVRIVLHPEVSVSVSVNVARSQAEAEAQAAGEAAPDAEAIFETEELAQAAQEQLSGEEAAEEAGGEATDSAPEAEADDTA